MGNVERQRIQRVGMGLVYRIREQKCDDHLKCPFRSGVRWDKFSAICAGNCLKKKDSENWQDVWKKR